MEKRSYSNIDEYIADFPENVAVILNKIRNCIQQSAPNATETISYNMPAFKQKKIVVYFAAFKNHIGFYPGASGVETFKDEITAYSTSKGTIQFTVEKPLPDELVMEIVKIRMKQNKEKMKNKKVKINQISNQ